MQWPNEEKKSKNDIQSITQETKDCAARTLQSTGVGKQFPSRGHTVSLTERNKYKVIIIFFNRSARAFHLAILFFLFNVLGAVDNF
jgi:hypothetical protein